MAVLFAFEEPRRFGEAYSRQYVCISSLFCLEFLIISFSSIRFAPPLVISQEDLEEAVKIIGECLLDLDQVSPPSFFFPPPKYVFSDPSFFLVG